MSKKIITLIWMICLTLILTGCKKDNIMKDYTSLTDKNHIYEEVNVDNVIKMLENKESFYLMMGFPECPWCQALMPVLNDVAKECCVNKIYYLYLKDIRDNENAKGHDLYLQLANNYFKDAIDDKNSRINAPTIVRVENGVMTSYHLNTVSSHIKNENGVLPPLTKEQNEELVSILKDFFK